MGWRVGGRVGFVCGCQICVGVEWKTDVGDGMCSWFVWVFVENGSCSTLPRCSGDQEILALVYIGISKMC